MEANETLPAPVNGTAIALVQEPAGLPMPVQTAHIVQRVEAVREIVNKVFKEGTHFGSIPGTGDKKTLLKPGFDTLCLAFQFSPEFIKQAESIERDNFINLVYKCRLIHSPTGRVIATGDGSCNSKEEKYRWTTLARKCPHCKAEAIIKGKAEYGGGWICFEKKGGCKAKFRDGDAAIETQPVGRAENDNPWNFHNTLTKMAQKRAGMAAIITACGLSSDFTQDMEDFEQNPKYQDPNLVDIQAGGHAGPVDGEVPKGENRGYDIHGDRPPQEWRDELEGAAQAAEGQFSEVPMPEDILQAREDVTILVRKCETKEDFQKLVAKMRSIGGSYKDQRVTAVLNEAYYTKFPKA